MIGEDLGVVRSLLLHGKRGLGKLSKSLLVLFEKNRLFKNTNSYDRKVVAVILLTIHLFTIKH